MSLNNCPHRSESFRLAECPSCNGAVQVKVYQCSKHGECTVAKQIAGVHVCDGFPKPVRATPVVHIPVQSNVHAGSLLDSIDRNSPTASVRLDDGQTIVAANERARKGHKTKRCVVEKQGEKWVLLQ